MPTSTKDQSIAALWAMLAMEAATCPVPMNHGEVGGHGEDGGINAAGGGGGASPCYRFVENGHIDRS